jgi:hypothetical protein
MKVKRDGRLVKAEWYWQAGVMASKLHWETVAGLQLQMTE